MSKTIKIVLLLLSIALLTYGCATSDVKEKGEAAAYDTAKIEPSRSYEECLEVYPGQVLDYSFKASDFVDFNIHYHTEEEIRYPVNEKGVRSGKGSISVDEMEYYTEEQEYLCLMWDNLNWESVKVSFSCQVKSKSK
jgi:hypothetical protein